MNRGKWKQIVTISLTAFVLLGAAAQDGDAKVIQYMDFLQHRDLINNQELIQFFAAVKGKDLARTTKPESKTMKELPPGKAQDRVVQGEATGGNVK